MLEVYGVGGFEVNRVHCYEEQKVGVGVYRGVDGICREGVQVSQAEGFRVIYFMYGHQSFLFW